MTFSEVLTRAGFEPRSYSGRGMRGTACVGVYIDRSGQPFGHLFAEILETVQKMNDNDRYYAIEKLRMAFHNMHADSLGMGTIVYFPEIPWEDEKACDAGSQP